MNIPIRSEWLKAAKLLPGDAERWQFISACIEYSQTVELPDLEALPEAVQELFEIFREAIKEAAGNRQRVRKHRDVTNNITSNVTCNVTSNVTCNQKEIPPAPPKENTKKRDTKVSPKESALSFEQLIPPALNTIEFSIAWQQWCKYRKSLRHAMTIETARRQLEMLGRYPPAVAIAAIDQSIQMGWQGLFPDKITLPAGKINHRDYTKI